LRFKSAPLKPAAKTPNHTRGELHPRNLHRAPYDFPRLIGRCPELAHFLQPHPLGGDTIDFADPAAVATLNRALLKLHYGVAHWEIPPGSLCPPVPSRADYLHHAAGLLAESNHGAPPRGPGIVALDIGTGANAIYPLIGSAVYGWRFVATDADAVSINWARGLIAANPPLAKTIDCRLQPATDAIFENIAGPDERFALSVCNPPFHASPEEAAAGTFRKLRNLGGGHPIKAVLNFGGQSHELWCPGGEVAFVRRMIRESAERPELCAWFTTLVSKHGNLPAIHRDLARARVADVRTLTMFAGQKQSRIVAWTFLPSALRIQRLSTNSPLSPSRSAR
jgi:23S rRNA (adenine1618-N6)-methyltransferase